MMVSVLGALSVESALLLEPLMEKYAASPVALAIKLAYPIGALALLSLIVLSLGGLRRSLVWRVISLAMAMFAFADTASMVFEITPQFDFGPTIIDVIWGLGILALGMSSWSGFASTPGHDEQRAVTIPYMLALASLSLMVIDRLHRLHPVAVALAAGTLLVAAINSGLAVREVRALAQSRKEARTDELTGLPNRRSFTEMIEESIERAALVGSPLAILMIDLDGFKVVNDTLGHHTGDELLRMVAQRFSGTLAPGDVLARLGGDEFGVVVHPREEVGWAFEAGMRLTQALDDRIDLDGLRLQVKGSTGIALYPDHGTSAALLLQRADVAMYEAKRAGGGVRFYSPNFDRNSREQLQRLEDLRLAIEGNQLALFYQPKVRFSDGVLVGVEALVRWQHPQRGLLAPDQFLPLAIAGGLLPHLTRSVLSIAISQAGRWRYEGTPIGVAVNVGSADLVDESLPGLIGELLQRYQVPASALTIEITEDAVIADPVRTASVVAEIRSFGAKVAVDDFGAGYASLSHLRELTSTNSSSIDRWWTASNIHRVNRRSCTQPSAWPMPLV